MKKLITQNPLVYLSLTMWKYAKGNRHNVVLYVVMFVIAGCIDIIEPLLIGFILTTIQTQGISAENLYYVLFLLCLFPIKELAFWVFHGPARIIENRNAFYVRAAYKNHLLNGTMSLPIEWHTDHHSGETIDKIEKGTTSLERFSAHSFEIILSIIQFVSAFLVLMFYDVLAGTVLIILTLPTFYIILLFDRKLVPGYKKVNTMENAISAKVFDTLSNVTTVIILRIESLVLSAINTFIQKPYEQYNTNIKVNEWKWFSAAMLGRVAVVSVLSLYIYYHWSLGTILVGTIYILYGYANQIRETFFRFAYLYNDIVRQRSSVANAEEISKDFKNIELTHTKLLPKDWKSLSLKDLSFSYQLDGDANPHLDGISLEIKKGERIALIGESGGGKSTFLKVLRDLYHPQKNILTIDSIKAELGFAAISDSISLVPQDPEIFATTIRENITLGVEYPEMHIQVFTDMACFSDVVTRLPKGLESSVVEKGVNLSGGEKQRLALSRGLLASVGKDIILLDEPTSSVDFHNELKIYDNIFDAFPHTTIISSIHRLHLLSKFDSIYFFKAGKIIASGSFDELKANSKDFQTLWDKYIETRDASAE